MTPSIQTTVLAAVMLAMWARSGNFVNMVADRLPAKQRLTILHPNCNSCKRLRLQSDLLPILGCLWSRRKCKYCTAPISPRVFTVEIVIPLLFTVTYIQHGISIESILISTMIVLLITVAVIDLEHRMILNRILLPSAATLLILSPFWNELGLSRTILGNSGFVASFMNSLLSGTGSMLTFLAISMLRPHSMGGGDIKFAGLIGLLLGFPGVFLAVASAFFMGGVVAITLLTFWRKSYKDLLAFGPFLSAGAIIVLLINIDTTSLVIP